MLPASLYDVNGMPSDLDLSRFFLEFESSGEDLRAIMPPTFEPYPDHFDFSLFSGPTSFIGDPSWAQVNGL